jgi:hypothetical protein
MTYYIEVVTPTDCWEYTDDFKIKSKAIERAKELESLGKIVRVLEVNVVYKTEEVS